MTRLGKVQTTKRKRRTREHVRCDLSANYVEFYALQCGYFTERISHDYGIDMNLYTYDKSGEIENGFISIHLTASLLKSECITINYVGLNLRTQ